MGIRSRKKPTALTLDGYRALVATLPRPTRQQREEFAEFVGGAHSWYKHLPLFPPGAPFWFFLDPCAGMQLVRRRRRLEFQPLREQGFHYSQIPTDEYRRRFGHLAYASPAGTKVALVERGVVLEGPTNHAATVFSKRAKGMVGLPSEVRDAGCVNLTGAIHRWQMPGSWLDCAKWERSALSWPEESGGLPALDAILERCRWLEEDREGARTARREAILRGYRMPDIALDELLRPERERQQREMVAAMERVLDLLG